MISAPAPGISKRTAALRLGLLLAALAPTGVATARELNDDSDAGSQIRIDVVVDMSEAGKKVAHPTPDKPAFYLPISVGYKTFGYAHNFQRPPPNEWDIQHALAIALYKEGYRLMTRQGHPSLVLVFWWGYMAPEEVDMNNQAMVTDRTGTLNAMKLFWGAGQDLMPNGPTDYSVVGMANGNADNSTLGGFITGFQNANEWQMSSLVAGDTINDHQKFPDPRLDDVIQMTTAPRYYVLVSAFDFQSWLHHKSVLLWRAHVSTELWGHYFDQVVGTLISTAAPEFGRETKVPHFTNADITPLGRVLLGTPVVKDYPLISSGTTPPK